METDRKVDRQSDRRGCILPVQRGEHVEKPRQVRGNQQYLLHMVAFYREPRWTGLHERKEAATIESKGLIGSTTNHAHMARGEI